MSLISKIAAFFRSSPPAGEAPEAVSAPRTTGQGWQDLIDLPLTPAMAVSTVYRCLQLLSDSVAVLPLEFRKLRGGAFITDTNSNLNYLANVQADVAMSAYDFKRQIVIELLTAGNAYIVPFYSVTKGDYVRLALCGRHTVTHDTLTDTYSVSDSRTGIFGVYHEDDIIHIKGMPGPDPKQGLSVLAHARQAVNIAAAGARETHNRFTNGGDVRGIVTNGKDVRGFGEYQDAELDRKAADLDERFRLLGERIVALGGQVGWIPISMTSADMQFLESRKFTVRELCRFFGVHPSFVFDDTSNNYKSAEMANVAFLSNTLNPLLVKIENEFLRKLYPPAYAMKRKVTFDRRALQACDLQSRVAYLSKLLGLGLTVNEVRGMEDLPPVEGGDVPLVSANLKSISQILAESAAPAPAGNDETNDKDDDNGIN